MRVHDTFPIFLEQWKILLVVCVVPTSCSLLDRFVNDMMQSKFDYQISNHFNQIDLVTAITPDQGYLCSNSVILYVLTRVLTFIHSFIRLGRLLDYK